MSEASCITIFGSFNDLGKGYKLDYGVHPNALGHKLMAPLWKDFIIRLLTTG